MEALAAFVQELRQRRVVRALVAYGAGAAAVLQGADMIFTALALPDLAYRIMVIASIAGFPLVAVLAWVYDLTAQGLRRASRISLVQGRARVPLSRYLQLVGAFTVTALIVLSTAGAVSHLRYPSSDDSGRVGLAVFPLRTAGTTGDEWSQGVADLLATALQGTPSLRVIDPWPLWRPLRPEPESAARSPGLDEAEALTEEAGGHRFILGSSVASGDGVEVAFRLYRVGRAEPVDAFTVSAGPDGMADAVREAAVRILTRVWGPLRSPDVPPELDFDATQSPEALKAYLAAKEAFRRGIVDSANTAIDRALSLDSTFVLAMVDAVLIKSWRLSLKGQIYTGFFQILARAEPFEETLDPRSRLRLEATRAAVRTDGPAAIAAVRGILEMDSLDYGANASLAYYRRAYGWQLTPPAHGSRALAERVVQLDSTQLPALAARAWWAVCLGDTADERAQLRRLLLADTVGVLGKSRIWSLRALLASPEAFEQMAPELAMLSPPEFVALSRHLRAGRPARYRRFLDATADAPDETVRTGTLQGRLRLDVAQGWAVRADSSVEAGVYGDFARGHRLVAEMLLVASDLAGVGDRVAAERAVGALTRYIPPDSAVAYFQDHPVWPVAWILGAWNAQVGDTVTAHLWKDVIGTLPPGGAPKDYRGGLRADIDARLAIRRGETARARTLERTAMELWSIHADNSFEYLPEPMMRLTLALLLRDAGQRQEATALLSSLVLPTTWLGFLTARADFELGQLAAERGDTASAAFHLRRALAMWADGGPAVSSWEERARTGLDAPEGS